ncbi:RNA 3'-terminal phosphate cyclase-like isoform X1 [Vespa velutina]|uniref:RNA 3'-terminal phosphate cyclase-like isoform X1 n=2 Tax=Vespa velutina TaxID=202808 RepID=UPI001FB3F2BB|nr:RNA 3'-terminal phosphate cyclase-like isoform X1 [Vespa velutina]XP_047353778.1 RNA 3'-terminal phosphate cyclase-like isoform X1 [Vespa velutina]XP_047353779.1 RNA 3'-terminal phosphate cyclase-like isoform X1 [Vespa velutina]XP_047353780.1 RNA 3'-terminal phosphate cyclase-like isoform X1 [Vespa velutina]XP_047353781.1 RNA 3'-terminal phosphate cyclase-like isoform X1 [Vespa velutina]XP_047353782.1 RNA 3'-terminal phosphate cyclase-like isoform X1 [Vespa velutina]XP_047353783.1 RNA 3'-t
MFRSFSKMPSIIKIDGSIGEGGGQVLRLAVSLSALYGIPIEINNIRAGRSTPGLARQHLKGIELVKDMCSAEVSGAYLGSTHLKFYPKSLHRYATEFEAALPTNGSICLLAQIALPCVLFLPQKSDILLILKGGTNVTMAPHIEYLTEVIRPILNKFGADFDFVILKRGYYPDGVGTVHLRITPIRNLNAVNIIDLGILRKISGWAYVTGYISIKEAEKIAIDAKTSLNFKLTKNNVEVPPINIESSKEHRQTYGSGINIVCSTTTGCMFGGTGMTLKMRQMVKPGIFAANEALEPFLNGACVDYYAQDQIIIFMALAKGISRVKIGNKITSHTKTAMKIAEIMLGNRGLRFHLLESGRVGNSPSYILECEGCGLINNFTE